MKIIIFLSIAFISFTVLAEETIHADGQVTLPLTQYQGLLQQAASQDPPAPSSYAVGQSLLNINFNQQGRHMTATVKASLDVETFEDKWTLVALLGPGAALESASVDGSSVQLLQRADGLFWLSKSRQKVSIQLTYHVDAHFSDLAYVTSLPVPRAAASRFNLKIPQLHIDLTVAPATNLVKSEQENATVASGTMASSHSMMIAWRVAQEQEFIMSQATYSGSIQGEAIAWDASIVTEMLVDSEITVPLISRHATLVAVDVDGKPAMVFTRDGRFAVRLAGVGQHRIHLSFLSAITYPDGVPSSDFDIPGVPISEFNLTLPGEKLVKVEPAANVETEVTQSATKVSFFIPMSQSVALTWMEAIPEYVAIESRSNAVVYHALHAAEGVLYGQAAIHYEITRGEANSLQFSIPASAQVNSITSASGAIVDWTLLESDSNESLNIIEVFLNRAIKGEFVLDIGFEQLLNDKQVDIGVPMLRALDVIRQKGMMVLLSGSDLALEPGEYRDMSEVGENQLPAFFRNQLEQTVSHTYKYHADQAQMQIKTVTPQREQGKFNAQVDSLISIGEVTVKGQVSIGIDVKSGVLRDLQLKFPSRINILGVSGPSIRTHQVSVDGDYQQINIEFTQEMDGQFRLELNYERIMLDGTAETSVPRIEVVEAEVEHGRIAIEALSALEVQPNRVEQLSTLEINELPRQLVLKTTNPILLAYRYVKTEKPFMLSLSITRHEEIDVQVAAIDTAIYQTLFTSDGLAVTRVQFDVRNSRRQFLRLALPVGSEIWSVFVNGQAQKPAFASDRHEDSRDVLIKMVNSSTAFPVELVYATHNEQMETFGRIEGTLPRPDMIVTNSRWDVYVPATPRYGTPRTNMDVVSSNIIQTVRVPGASLLGDMEASVINGEPLHIDLPTQGILFSFAKLYANQSEDDAYFKLRYVHQRAGFAGLWISLLATAAIWAGIILTGLKNTSANRHLPVVLLVSGIFMLGLSVMLLGTSITPASVLSLLIVSLAGVWLALKKWQMWRN